MNIIFTIISIPIFVILFTVIYRTIRSAMDCTEKVAKVLTVCVSLLCIIGMHRFLQGAVEIILIPYVVLTLLILALLLFGRRFMVIKKHHQKPKKRKHDADNDRLLK